MPPPPDLISCRFEHGEKYLKISGLLLQNSVDIDADPISEFWPPGIFCPFCSFAKGLWLDHGQTMLQTEPVADMLDDKSG